MREWSLLKNAKEDEESLILHVSRAEVLSHIVYAIVTILSSFDVVSSPHNLFVSISNNHLPRYDMFF